MNISIELIFTFKNKQREKENEKFQETIIKKAQQ